MKLYQEFKKHLNELGTIKLAWFTTFNIDLYFFEKYILSALAEMDHEHLKTVTDYEVLNKMFVEDDEGSNHIDVKLFYDFRANNTRDSKKTCVQTVPIVPDFFKKYTKKFKGGVFHPKIGLIVNQKNEGIILATSANMSVNGWAHNSECAVFKKITDKSNAQNITDFFLALIKKENAETLIEINRIWQNKLSEESVGWNFTSSFQNEGLLDKLSSIKNEITVWSPYFSDELPTIIAHHFTNTRVNIIPDVEGNNKVRISKDTLQLLKERSNILIKKDLYDFKGETKPFVHAKTWLTSSKLAIGSWNFTQSGLNLGETRNNIEAGIISNINDESYLKICNSCQLENFEDASGMTINELEEERNQSLNEFSFACQIFADWNSFKYFIEEEISEEINYYVNLPGLSQPVSLKKLKDGISFLYASKALLKNRIFTVFESDNSEKQVYIGIINELNISNRPAVGFENIDDFFNAWLGNNPEGETNKHTLLYKSDEETGEEINPNILERMSADYSHGWFTMFLAVENMIKSIEKNSDDGRKLKQIGFHIPGSVFQLWDQVNQLKFKYKKKENIISAPFLWFLINEGNRVIDKFNEKAENFGFSKIEKIGIIPINLNKSKSNYSQRKLNKWLKVINEKCYE